MTTGPLSGLRVVDLTTVIMGPMATSLLGDLGAEVVKVESPAGDINRRMGRVLSGDQSELSLNLNRNKRSAVLDLKSESGRDALLELVRGADAFVTNMRPASLARLGITPSRLRELNPELVFVTAQGYASDSDQADAPAYDDIVQAASGFAGLSLHVDGAQGEPAFAPYVAGDKITALYIVIGLLAGVHQREVTGRGSEVEVPMVDTLMSFNLVENLAGLTALAQPGGFGWARTTAGRRALYRAADAWITVLPYTDRNWADFFGLLGRTDLADDERFATLASRTAHMPELIDTISPEIARRTAAAWLADCAALDVPAALVKDPAEVISDEYAWASGVLKLAEHPTVGQYRRMTTPIRFDGTAPDPGLPAPALPTSRTEQTSRRHRQERHRDLGSVTAVRRPVHLRRQHRAGEEVRHDNHEHDPGDRLMAIDITDNGKVRTISTNRPAKANALLAADVVALEQAVLGAAEDCRVLVFAGTGGRNFSAGMDLGTFQGASESEARGIIASIGSLLRTIRHAPQLSIVALEGACIGAAFELALAADLRVAHPAALVGLPEVKLGIPSVVDAALLHHYVGLATAKEMLLTGEPRTIEELAHTGLANRVVEREEVVPVAQEWAAELASLPALAVREQRALIDEWLNVSLQNAVDQSITTFARMFRTSETSNNITSYTANRKTTP
ncbi:CoA transferase [Saccharopolyspora sp. NPDC000359]|uniref:CoA transferase n=1 Tax=Saccharopolyspora sp. NPDC000359 TaxID=3154251 RepID=UPI00332A3D41